MNTCELKKLYIPQCVKGTVSISQAARLIGCTRQTVINLKKKFRDIGEKAFIHASKGRRSPNAVNAEICISEDFGVKCFYSGKFYDVVLDDTVSDLHGGKLTQVEQDLFARFFLSDKHSNFAKIG